MQRRFPIALMLITFVFSTAIPAAADAVRSDALPAAAWQPCPLRTYPAPQPSSISGCLRASCVKIAGHKQICKCSKADDSTAVMILVTKGKVTGGWPVQSYVGDMEDFEVREGPVGPGGEQRYVVANRDVESVGMGVTRWTVALALADPAHFASAPHFQVSDYGPGIFARENEAGKCFVLITSWEGGTDPKRGSGLYFVARPHRIAENGLEPMAGMPTLRRRYLNRFEKERERTFRNRGGSAADVPLSWFRAP